jgi:hypothetical protein
VFGKLFWTAGAKMVTSHKATIFVPSCNSTLRNTGSARNLTLTITFLKQCEYLSTGRGLPTSDSVLLSGASYNIIEKNTGLSVLYRCINHTIKIAYNNG